MAFLLTNGTASPYSQASQWQGLTASQRANVKAQYAQAGIKLFVSAFGSTESPTTLGINPNSTATAMATWVKDYGVDGIDIDYEVCPSSQYPLSHSSSVIQDFPAFTAGTSEQWLIDFTKQLYSDLGGQYLITHARKSFLHVEFVCALIGEFLAIAGWQVISTSMVISLTLTPGFRLRDPSFPTEDIVQLMEPWAV